MCVCVCSCNDLSEWAKTLRSNGFTGSREIHPTNHLDSAPRPKTFMTPKKVTEGENTLRHSFHSHTSGPVPMHLSSAKMVTIRWLDIWHKM